MRALRERVKIAPAFVRSPYACRDHSPTLQDTTYYPHSGSSSAEGRRCFFRDEQEK